LIQTGGCPFFVLPLFRPPGHLWDCFFAQSWETLSTVTYPGAPIMLEHFL